MGFINIFEGTMYCVHVCICKLFHFGGSVIRNVFLDRAVIRTRIAEIIVTAPNVLPDQDFISFHADFLNGPFPPSYVH